MALRDDYELRVGPSRPDRHVHADLDGASGYEALDKEFQQIIRRAQVGKQVADMLFKVWLNDGDECWLFIHSFARRARIAAPEAA